MILMTFLSLNQMLRAKECISLLPFVISQQQTKVRQCFPGALAETGRFSPAHFWGHPAEHWFLSSAPALPGICGGFGTASLCVGKAARSQAAEEEMEEVGSVPWPARDFPPERPPDALSSCVSALCL